MLWGTQTINMRVVGLSEAFGSKVVKPELYLIAATLVPVLIIRVNEYEWGSMGVN